MKNFEFNSFGMTEMTVQETRDTNGGSLTVLIICAAAALLLSSCNMSGSEININILNGNKGGNVNAQVGLNGVGTDTISTNPTE